MRLRRWVLHAIAAIIGFAASAAIVVVVFSTADREAASTGGAKPSGASDASATRCTRIPPGKGADATSIATARRSLPPIYDEHQIQVKVTSGSQLAWFARIHAALGLCTNEVDVARRFVTIDVAFPEGTSERDVRAYVFGALVQAFSPPLARSRVHLDVGVGSSTSAPRVVEIHADAWNAFQRAHVAMRLPDSFAGLRAFRSKVGYGASQIRLTGW